MPFRFRHARRPPSVIPREKTLQPETANVKRSRTKQRTAVAKASVGSASFFQPRAITPGRCHMKVSSSRDPLAYSRERELRAGLRAVCPIPFFDPEIRSRG